MIPVFLTTFISCSQAFTIINRLQVVMGLTYQQKMEIVNELRKVVPSCPIIVNPDDPTTKKRN
jgi:hypothetical protein